MPLPRLCLGFILLAFASNAFASKHRAIWFWRSTGNQYGSAHIVGNSSLEDSHISFFQDQSIRRVYGSFGTRTIDERAVIAAWNAKLNAVGIQSQSLMSENTWIFPATRPNLLSNIQTRLIDFNNHPDTLPDQEFDALHLDIEPQALPNWSSLTPTEKRDHLFLLRDTFADIRSTLVNADLPNFPVYADLPVWFDNLPGDGGSIGWTNAAERDQWFDAVATSLTGITLMPFERTSFGSIDNGVSWELANITGATVRVALEADVGAGATWTDIPDFINMMETLEANYGSSKSVDIQSYRQWREAIDAQPLLAVSAAVQLLTPTSLTGQLAFDVKPNLTYTVFHSTNLCNWLEIHREKASESGEVRITFNKDQSKQFWTVRSFEENRPD